jgi:hypothetical protein
MYFDLGLPVLAAIESDQITLDDTKNWMEFACEVQSGEMVIQLSHN